MTREQKSAPDTFEARRDGRDVNHGITVNQSAAEPHRFEALCLCGWASSLYEDRRRAVAAGNWHARDEALASERPRNPSEVPTSAIPDESASRPADRRPCTTRSPVLTVTCSTRHRVGAG